MILPVVSGRLLITNNLHIRVFSASAYQDPLKRLILSKNQQHTVASTQLARIMLERLPFTEIQADFIIPIPLHWSRYAWRGYNQAEVISNYIGKHMNIPVLHALKRIKRTPFLSSTTAQNRPQEVADAFQVIEKEKYGILLQGKNVILVDDLCTTGATLKQAARALMPYSPARIDAAVAARVI